MYHILFHQNKITLSLALSRRCDGGMVSSSSLSVLNGSSVFCFGSFRMQRPLRRYAPHVQADDGDSRAFVFRPYVSSFFEGMGCRFTETETPPGTPVRVFPCRLSLKACAAVSHPPCSPALLLFLYAGDGIPVRGRRFFSLFLFCSPWTIGTRSVGGDTCG